MPRTRRRIPARKCRVPRAGARHFPSCLEINKFEHMPRTGAVYPAPLVWLSFSSCILFFQKTKSLNKCRVPGTSGLFFSYKKIKQIPGTWHFLSCIYNFFQKAKSLKKCRVPGAGYPPFLPCLFPNRQENAGYPAPGTPYFPLCLESKRLNKCRVPGAGYPALLLCLSLTKMPGTRHFSSCIIFFQKAKNLNKCRTRRRVPGVRHFWFVCLLPNFNLPGTWHGSCYIILFRKQYVCLLPKSKMPGTRHFSLCIILCQKAKSLNKCRVPGTSGYLFLTSISSAGYPALRFLYNSLSKNKKSK